MKFFGSLKLLLRFFYLSFNACNHILISSKTHTSKVTFCPCVIEKNLNPRVLPPSSFEGRRKDKSFFLPLFISKFISQFQKVKTQTPGVYLSRCLVLSLIGGVIVSSCLKTPSLHSAHPTLIILTACANFKLTNQMSM